MKWVRITIALLFIVQVSNAETVTRFRANLTESFVILDGVQGTGSAATAVADFVLIQDENDPSLTTMSYTVQFQNVDLDGAQTPDPLDNITALHLHDTTACAPSFPQCIAGTDTAGTVHLLNIYGSPRLDDDDVMVDAPAGIVTGLWDDGDATPGLPAPSFAISDPQVLNRLMNEQVALFVHTNEVPTAASGGFLLIVPEPSGLALLSGLVSLVCLVRRRYSS